MSLQRIILTGGPSSGKTTLLKALQTSGSISYPETSRELIQKAQEQDIDQPFLTDPIAFSRMLLKDRIAQFEDSSEYNQKVYFDRGIPDTYAYHVYSGDIIPDDFTKACKKYRYDMVFICPPWKAIHTTDGERYESFEQAVAIYDALVQTYHDFDYRTIAVPFGKVEERVSFVMTYS